MLLQLKIQIKGINKPPVWRKVLVPGQFTFSRLHEVIQEAFGWGNYHLYEFSPRGYGSSPQIGIADEEWADDEVEDAEKVKLRDVFDKKGQKYVYIYDFGDDWTHLITVEDVLDRKAIAAQLLSGKVTCPPEDCGGPWGFEELKEIVSDSKHGEYEEMRECLGMESDEEWDTEDFDLDSAQQEVSKV